MIFAPCLALPRERARRLLLRREALQSHCCQKVGQPIPHFTACPKQMGDSGNWHQGPRRAVMALSPEIMHLCWGGCEKPGEQRQSKRETAPRAGLNDVEQKHMRSESVRIFKDLSELFLSETDVCHFYLKLYCAAIHRISLHLLCLWLMLSVRMKNISKHKLFFFIRHKNAQKGTI